MIETRYGALTVFSKDTGALTKSLIKYGEWAENELNFLRRFIPASCTVVDVGAYIGTHTLAFAQATGSQGRVIAIEAQPDTFTLLEQNIAGHGGTVEVHNAVASSELGTISIPKIDVTQESSFGSTSLIETLSGAEQRQKDAYPHAAVPSITIDSLALSHCGLIKIDVEGAEDLVLQGALDTLRRCSPVVYCECNTITAGLKTLAVLEASGYRAFGHVVNAYNPDNFMNEQENIFGNAREVALLGVPASQTENIRSLPLDSVELLLEIHNADDLALALLNKPQYPSEVLRISQAARAGGDAILDEFDAAKVEEQAAEIVALHALLHERDEAILSLQTHAKLRAEELADLHLLMTQRDSQIAGLQSDIKQQAGELSDLHAALQKRDLDIARLQTEIGHHAEELTQVHAALGQRDQDIAGLQDEAKLRIREITALHALLQQRDGDIERLKDEVSHNVRAVGELHILLEERDRDGQRSLSEMAEQTRQVADLRSLLTERDEHVAVLRAEAIAQEADLGQLRETIKDLYASDSWRVTKPLRWATGQVKRVPGPFKR